MTGADTLVAVPVTLPSHRVLAISAVAAVGAGVGGYLFGHDAGTHDPPALSVPRLQSVTTGNDRPEIILPGRTPTPDKVNK